ncbi:hypothetical protein [Microscilla marina]|nr:hypothetical protein [Microscilla marina]
MNKTSFTPEQKAEYLQLVENFRKYWETLNKRDGKNNVYDDPKTNEGPEATFDIIRKVLEKKK